MPTFQELTQTYLVGCKVEGKSPRTITAYDQSLRVWGVVAEELGFPPDVAALTVQHAYGFLNAVQERGASRGYQHRLHVEIRTFFAWCVRMELIPTNVLNRVPLVKRDQPLIQPFSPLEISLLLRTGAAMQRTASRNRALILFLLDTGVRVSECVQVRFDDVDWEGGRVRILHGKGRKQRWVGIGANATSALRGYVELVRGRAPGPLFVSTYTRGPMRTFAVNTLLSRLGAIAGVAHVYPHRFRHTFATWSLRSNAREIDVQMLLGHSSMAMTQRYARTYSSEQAVVEHRTFSPASLVDAT